MQSTRIIHTEGKGKFEEGTYEVPKCQVNQITVQSHMVGVCRSDVDQMLGLFGPLPLHMQGHEGLGKVIECGANIKDVQVGDWVATRGEPAYADRYVATEGTYVRVPECLPRYIIEPVACAINCVTQHKSLIDAKNLTNCRLAIIGTGFLANIIYQYLQHHYQFDIDVIGEHHQAEWPCELRSKPQGPYDVVIDLNSRQEILEPNLFKPSAVLVLAAEKKHTITTTFSEWLWQAITVIFPSPRHHGFHQVMLDTVKLIESGVIEVDQFWSKSYDRDTEWRQAFEDGVNRPKGYHRGYIQWR